jgi:ribosome recycling factor
MKPAQQPATTGSHPFATTKEVEANAKQRMEKVLVEFQHEISHIRTGRASINLLDSIRVDYYGTPSPLSHVGTVHVPEPAMITIQPFDNSMIGVIEKAIRTSDLGLNPANDGKLIRIPIPPLTEERRRDFVKKLHVIAEEHRVSLRTVRRDSNELVKKLVKDKLISEDDDRRAHDEIQKMTDAYIGKIDGVSKGKEKEILEIK